MTKLTTNSLLLISGFITSISGIIIQICYHLIKRTHNHTIIGFDYTQWSNIHKITSVIFLFFCVLHIYTHRKWFKIVLAKKTLRKKNRQTLLLSIIFIISAITGFISWIIINSTKHTELIEIHDKVSVLLLILIALHTIKRIKRFM